MKIADYKSTIQNSKTANPLQTTTKKNRSRIAPATAP